MISIEVNAYKLPMVFKNITIHLLLHDFQKPITLNGIEQEEVTKILQENCFPF